MPERDQPDLDHVRDAMREHDERQEAERADHPHEPEEAAEPPPDGDDEEE